MIRTVLRACGHLACTRYREVLLLGLALMVLSLIPPIFFSGSRFSASVSKMMPADNDSAKAFVRALDDFGAADEVFVVFRIEREEDIEAVGEHVVRLAAELRDHQDFQDAYCRYVRPAERGFFEEELLRRGLLYMPPAAIAEADERLSGRSLRRAVRSTARKLEISDEAAGREALLLIRELGLVDLLQTHMPALANRLEASRQTNAGGYMVAPGEGPNDPSILLLAAQPRGPAQRLEYSERIMEVVRAEVERTLAALPPALADGVRAEYAGGYEVAVRYTDSIAESLSYTLLTSLVGVLLLFGYCYRRYGVMLYVGVPLIMIVSWTIGAGWLVFGKLNMISCAFAAVLVGLGVDYAIHIYNRYVEERGRGSPVEQSFVVSLEETGTGVVIGMLTTSLSFFALMVTRFKGLSQFGTLAGMGLALALPGMVFVLPALVTWRSKQGHGEHARALTSTTFYLPELLSLIRRHPRWVAGVGVGLAALSALYLAVGGRRLRFDERLSSLRPTNDPVFQLGSEIARKFSRKSPARQMVLATGPTQAAAMNNAAALKAPLERLKEAGKLEDYELLTDLLPSPAQQAARREALGRLDFERIAAALRQALARRHLRPEVFERVFAFLENHQRLSESREVLLPTDFRGEAAWRLIRRLVARHKERYSVDPEDEENVYERLAAGHQPVLAEVPTSRQGGYYFTAGRRLTPRALAYLEERRVEQILVRSGREDEARPLRLPAQQPVEGLVYARDVTLPDGRPVIHEDMVVTERLARFLHASDCREVTVYDRGWSVLAYAYPPDAQATELRQDWIQEVRRELGVDGETLFLTGTMVVAHDLGTIVRDDFFKISVWVSIIAALVLVVCYRSPTRVFFSLVPIALSLLYLLGIMSFCGIYFNFINVLVVPIIIGLGVDNGIHLTHRFHVAGRDVGPVVTDTGRAIVITNLTSMVGFGSLYVGSYKGLASMGLLSILGLSMALVASLVVLPALMHLFLGQRGDGGPTGQTPDESV